MDDTEIYIFNGRTQKLEAYNDECFSKDLQYRNLDPTKKGKTNGWASCKGTSLSCASISLESDTEYYAVVTRYCDDIWGDGCTVEKR